MATQTPYEVLGVKPDAGAELNLMPAIGFGQVLLTVVDIGDILARSGRRVSGAVPGARDRRPSGAVERIRQTQNGIDIAVGGCSGVELKVLPRIAEQELAEERRRKGMGP